MGAAWQTFSSASLDGRWKECSPVYDPLTTFYEESRIGLVVLDRPGPYYPMSE